MTNLDLHEELENALRKRATELSLNFQVYAFAGRKNYEVKTVGEPIVRLDVKFENNDIALVFGYFVYRNKMREPTRTPNGRIKFDTINSGFQVQYSGEPERFFSPTDLAYTLLDDMNIQAKA
jgi:hypothetical protein